MTPRDQLDLRKFRVLDGGMATELEYLGADISGPLWSAHVLEESPEKILAVHRAYLDAGADVLLTASYQVSRKAYREFGLPIEQADRALLRAVELASEACREFASRKVLIAASLGPYGAALHDGSEYHGRYDVSHAELVEFHQERIAVVAESEADLLAFETLPSIEEARAIGQALAAWPNLAAWLTFTCKDEKRVAHGEPLQECAALVATFPQTVAIGINCTAPDLLPALIKELTAASDKPVVLYPNSGEGWDAEHRCWTPAAGLSDPSSYAQQASRWYSSGAQLVGGCCRTRPAHIEQVARIAAKW
jgi:homocysteine S-methyltransferase